MAYVKEIHGGTFRRVELSGLLDSAMKLKKQEKESKARTSITIRWAFLPQIFMYLILGKIDLVCYILYT